MQGSIARLAVQALMVLLVLCKEEPLQQIKRIKKSLAMRTLVLIVQMVILVNVTYKSPSFETT